MKRRENGRERSSPWYAATKSRGSALYRSERGVALPLVTAAESRLSGANQRLRQPPCLVKPPAQRHRPHKPRLRQCGDVPVVLVVMHSAVGTEMDRPRLPRGTEGG